jgi:hypothetical protein
MKPTLALILLAAVTGTAAAQPTQPTTEPLPGTPFDQPAQPPAQPPQPPQPPQAAVTHNDDGGGEVRTTGRPEGIAFGIGVGYTLPTSLQTPNTTSVRVRFRSGFTLEPIAVLGNESTKQDSGGATSKDSTTELTLGALARIPMIRRGKIELELLAGAGFGTVKNNPDGDDNNTTTSSINFNWGIAVSYWYSAHWNLTFSARNPLLSFAKTEREMTMSETSTTTVAAEWAPIVSVMLHLYN